MPANVAHVTLTFPSGPERIVMAVLYQEVQLVLKLQHPPPCMSYS